MKYFIIISAAIILAGCNSAAPISQGPEMPAENRAANAGKDLESVAAHTTENENPTMTTPAANKPEHQGPVGEPIDTTEFDAAIKAATKEMAASPKSTEVKERLGGAYFSRAFALTQARQYPSALGDYRRALKYDPTNDEAQKWIGVIESIYKTMPDKTLPKEGEEPEPLPFKKAEN
jgi:tetratricopeptide (TPR) repeat protein